MVTKSCKNIRGCIGDSCKRVLNNQGKSILSTKFWICQLRQQKIDCEAKYVNNSWEHFPLSKLWYIKHLLNLSWPPHLHLPCTHLNHLYKSRISADIQSSAPHECVCVCMSLCMCVKCFWRGSIHLLVFFYCNNFFFYDGRNFDNKTQKVALKFI